MKFQDSSFNGLKVTVGTKSVTHARTHARSKSNMPHQLFQSWGHKKGILFFSEVWGVANALPLLFSEGANDHLYTFLEGKKCPLSYIN